MTTQDTLSRDDVEFFERNGYVGPFDLQAPDLVASVRALIDEDLLTRASPIYGGESRRDWHLASKPVFELCAHPAIVERLAGILGPDILVWRSQMFYKKPADGETAWHQDYNFPGPFKVPSIDPPVTVTAWIALDETTVENGCVELVAGSHKEGRIDTVKDLSGHGIFGRNYRLGREVCEDDEIVRMILKPGQFFLFSNMTVHGSGPNNSNTTRLGLGVRYTRPDVRVYAGLSVDGQGMSLANYGSVLVRGQNAFDHNRMRTPPDDRAFDADGQGIPVDTSRDNGVTAGYRLGYMKGERHLARGMRIDMDGRDILPDSALAHASGEYADPAVYLEGFKEGLAAGYNDGVDGRPFDSRHGALLDAGPARGRRKAGPIRRIIRMVRRRLKKR